jgi:AcrR family transcriptional regulator
LRRAGLTRERVLAAAVALADEGGVEELSVRKLAKKLGVEAMSLNNHVANKDRLLDSRPNLGEANVGLYEAALECLREAGFSAEMAIRAQPIQDAYICGFALQETTHHEEEFLFGLDLILDGLEKRLAAGRGRGG